MAMTGRPSHLLLKIFYQRIEGVDVNLMLVFSRVPMAFYPNSLRSKHSVLLVLLHALPNVKIGLASCVQIGWSTLPTTRPYAKLYKLSFPHGWNATAKEVVDFCTWKKWGLTSWEWEQESIIWGWVSCFVYTLYMGTKAAKQLFLLYKYKEV